MADDLDDLFYWSSSEFSATHAVSLVVDAAGSDHGLSWSNDNKDSSTTYHRVRPVLAF